MEYLSKVSYTYDFIDPSEKDNYKWKCIPSMRGPNQLNIYTDNYYNKTKKNGTGVNAWGYEAAVNSKGIVVDLADRVRIPKNGYVLSGNEIAANFIRNNILLGSKIHIIKETKQLLVETNYLVSYYLDLCTKKQSIEKRYKKAIKNEYLIDKRKIEYELENIKFLKEKMKKIIHKKNLSNIEYNNFLKDYKNVLKKLNKLYLLTSNSRRIESRNVWTRPYEQNLSEIKETLDICKSCNINGVYLESFYNGDIPGQSKITQTNEEVVNGYYGEDYQNDYLKAFITEAHKRNIEVHAWVECFFVGEKHVQWKESYKNEWHMVNYDGSTIQGNNNEHNEDDFIWLDPANPECLKYILSIFEELFTNYDFDGINIDYVRYPHGNLELYSSNGYTHYAMNEFKEIYQLQGKVKELVKDPKINQLWVEYRCKKINLLVKEIKKLVNRVKPSCFISTSVCSDIHYAINNKMQNWKEWAKKGWLDLTFPMAYYIGCSEIANATKELVSFNKGNAFSYTGIMCMEKNLPSMLVVEQINTLVENKADGYALFQLNDLIKRKDCQKNLKMSVNRLESVHPHSHPQIILQTFLKSLKERKNYFYNDITPVIKQLSKIKTLDCKNIIRQLKQIQKTLSNNKNIKSEIQTIIYYLSLQLRIHSRKCKTSDE